MKMMEMQVKKRMFLLMFALILLCSGCAQKQSEHNDADEPSQTVTGSADLPVDVYEVQEEEE